MTVGFRKVGIREDTEEEVTDGSRCCVSTSLILYTFFTGMRKGHLSQRSFDDVYPKKEDWIGEGTRESMARDLATRLFSVVRPGLSFSFCLVI